EPFQHAMSDRGRRLRLYTPVGELLPGMAYLVRRLLENTSNESFLRKEYVESQPLSLLLSPPDGAPSHPASSSPVEHRSSPYTSPTEFVNEPVADFSRAPARTAMTDAIERRRKHLGQRLDLSTLAAHLPTGPDLSTRNPSHPEQIVAVVQSYQPADVPALTKIAGAAEESWTRRPVADRVAVMRKAASLMRDQRWDLAAWEVFEEGKPWREADADVAEAIDFLEYYAGEMARLGPPPRLGRYPGELNEVLWNSRGVTVVIAPWNFPLAIPTGMVAAALVAGNPVLFKPSERSSAMGYQLARILLDAGVPKGLLQYVPGGPELGRELVESAAVRTIAFT
ncbi:MAG: proline dehydrogenase family protein, partial [Nitrospira sp.]|nr:proline dehydrogenase family protein [Nitrospira sp.]